jgi:tubulin polyglutamylase TTLL6/13
MSGAGPSHSGDDDEEEAAPGGDLSNFFDNSNVDATDLTFTDIVVDEPVPGESDDEDYPAGSSAIAASRRRRRGKKNHRRIVVSLVSCKYDVVAQAARALGWRCTIDENEECNLLWNDSYVPFDTIAALNKYQKTNHFPGMSELAKKNLLAKNLNRIAKALPGEFNFFPPTFILPGEAEPLKNWVASQKRRPTLILKPDAGCQGRGIFLTKSLDACLEVEGMVAQQYLPAPLLVDGYKFDMRLYA